MDNQNSNEHMNDRPPQPRPSGSPQPPVSGPLASFEAWLYDMLVVKAPWQIPTGAKEWIVRYGPWITLVAGILLALTVIPALMAAVAITGYTATYGGMYGAAAVAGVVGPMFYLALAVLVVQLIIMFVSVPMLLKHQRKGWLLVFYSSVVSLVYTVLSSLSYGYFNFGGLLMGLVGAVLSMYILFQIRSHYVN